jgi:hypothetical protein
MRRLLDANDMPSTAPMVLRLNPDSKRLPFGGHHFHEYGMTFKGDTFKEVVKKVADFRLTNNLPSGDPEQEVLGYYARQWPWLVKEEHKPIAIETQSQEYFQLRDWIYMAWKKPATKLLSVKECKDRWEICRDCPFNLQPNWDETKESAELTRRSFVLRRGQDTPDYLGFCALHKADLSAFSFIEAAKEYSAKKEGDSYPGCWVL